MKSFRSTALAIILVSTSVAVAADEPRPRCYETLGEFGAVPPFAQVRADVLARVRERHPHIEDIRVVEERGMANIFSVEIQEYGQWRSLGGLRISIESSMIKLESSLIHPSFRGLGLYKLALQFAVEHKPTLDIVTASFENANAAAFAMAATGEPDASIIPATRKFQSDEAFAKAAVAKMEAELLAVRTPEQGRALREKWLDAYHRTPGGRANDDVGFAQLQSMRVEIAGSSLMINEVRAGRGTAASIVPRVYCAHLRGEKLVYLELTADGQVIELPGEPL